MHMFGFSVPAITMWISFTIISADPLHEWNNYKKQFHKDYSFKEDKMRKAIFEYNVEKIESHNNQSQQGLISHTLGVNQFSDLTPAEFQKFLNKMLKYLHPQKNDESEDYEDGEDYVTMVPKALLPKEVDWRKKGVVTTVKDQGTCGCCWAFAAAGAIEGAWALSKGQLINLSAQNLLDCTPGGSNFGCEGGNMDSAFQYVITNGGINGDDCYKYDQMQHSRCRYKHRCKLAIISKFLDIMEGDELALQEAVATRGPVAAAINGDYDDFQHYRSGIYSKKTCSEKVTHGVLVVGYGTNDKGQDFWIVKNSWGTRWGMDGYFMLERNKNMCGIAEMASFPLV